MDEAKQRILEDRTAKLSAFKQHPSWPELLAEFDRKRRRNDRQYEAYLAAGDAGKAQRAFDRAQGFDEALRWAQAVVEKAEDTLARTVALRETTTEGTTVGSS